MLNIENCLISVIIPTYNRGEILKETISSVLHQTYRNFELIIVDDGSTDNTKEIVLSIKDKRINYIWQENSGTPAAARNTGLKSAKGEYIAFLDSDDLWYPQKLEKQMSHFKNNGDVLGVAANGILIPMRPTIKLLSIKKNMKVTYRELLTTRSNPIITSSVLIKKSVVEAIGLLDEEFLLRAMEDYDYWLRILRYRDKSILILKDVLIKYRAHESNITINMYTDPIFFQRKYEKLVYIYDKHEGYIPDLLKVKIRETLYRYNIFKTRELLLLNKLSLFDILKKKKIMFYDRIWIILGYYSEKYLNSIKKNYVVVKINDFLKYVKHKILNLLSKPFKTVEIDEELDRKLRFRTSKDLVSKITPTYNQSNFLKQSIDKSFLLSIPSKNDYPCITILILNYNGWKYTIECLESVYQISYPNYEVIVMDNGSKDDSIEKIKEYCSGKIGIESNYIKIDPSNKPINVIEYKKVDIDKGIFPKDEDEISKLPSNRKLRLIINDKAYMYTMGTIIASKFIAKKITTDYIFQLNNDTVLEKNVLNELIAYGEKSEEIGILGPDIRMYDHPNLTQFIRLQNKTKPYIENDYVSGAAVLIKRELYDTVGFFDPRYIFNYEDKDYCYRAKDAGYKIMYIPTKDKIYHKIGGDSGGNSIKVSGFKLYFEFYGQFIFNRKYLSTPKFIIFIFKFFVTTFTRGFINGFIRKKSDSVSIIEGLKGIKDGILMVLKDKNLLVNKS